MIKQDWLDYFEAVNGRSATEAEIAQALAAGEFQEEQATQEASQFVGAPVAPEQANAGFVAAPAAPEEVTSQYVAAPEAPVQEAPQFAAAPEAPVQEAPQFAAAPEAPVQEAPQFTAAPEAPVQEAPQFAAAPEAPVQEAPQFTAAPEAPVFGAQPNGFQQAPQQQPQPGFGQPAPGQGFQQAPYPGQPQPGQAYYAQPAQPNAFGQAMKGFWSWIVSALARPTVENQPKILNGILHYVLTAFILSLSLFFVASAFPYAQVGFTAYLLIVIVTFFTLYAIQLTGFLVRHLVLQDKEYTYKRSFDEFARLSIYALPASLIVLILSLVKYFEGFSFLLSLIFVLYFLGLLYTVYQGLNRTKFKADKFLLLLASAAVILVIFTIVGMIDRRILEQVSFYVASFF
ncbi:DUF6574 domain-containing protein [Streptococcus australis]|uniref:DUF6574 domain-containing protein n=1 Tax=Streptococcus australis TaxID=113107 RepID=UPI00232E2984|nr:DUF6574 domain-containing protein [Streptococcus australis]MDB8641925.1 hypothetical protein [Streptococcus australis]MDB8645592.1 hypothetical protein [Streptococcus australis]